MKLRDPAKSEHYSNVNGHPNITRFCIDGVAFATTKRDYLPVMRVPEWDANRPDGSHGWCAS